MRSRIITSNQELERAEKANFALITYSNYMRAWIIFLDECYRLSSDGMTLFIERIKTSDVFRHMQGGAQISDELTNTYNRGRLTFRAMKILPIGNHPELALIANLWLPVQAYYAIHGIGLATMMALNMAPPQSHSTFRTAFSDLVKRYLPEPFCSVCSGGPELQNYRVCELNHLRRPDSIEEIECFIGKSLATTRTEFLAARFNETRRIKNKKKLKREEKELCCQNEHPTSICDLLYRLRLRANYYNPDMYLFADDPDEAKKQYNDILLLTEVLITGLEVLIERKVGKANMQTLKGDLVI